jgi:hypothetical protein
MEQRKFVPQTISLNIVRQVLGEEQFRAFEEGVKRYKEARAEERRRETLARENALKAAQEEHRLRMEKIKRNREERLRLVADLRRQGYSYSEIALAVGIPDIRAEQGDVPTWAQDDSILRSDISTRAKNAMSSADIWSFADLTEWSKGELLELPGFGRKSLNEISEVLMQMGLEFKPGGPPRRPWVLPKRYRPLKPNGGLNEE